jgi:hypothetical protein
MKTILMFLLIISTNVFASSYKSCKDLAQLEEWQLHNLRIAYNHGAHHGLQHTMMAIALLESNAGKWKVNYFSNDFGLFQINIETAANTLGVTDKYKKMELAELLIHNHDLNATIALSVLSHFDKGNYKEMIMSYNEGYRWRRDKTSKKKALSYYTTVSGYVKLLRQCRTWEM